jgi:hypothetical protein
MGIKHKTQSGRANNDDAGAIQPGDWNDDHEITGLLDAIDNLVVAPNSLIGLDGSSQPTTIPLNTLAPSFNPVFSGTAQAPTPPTGANDTRIATMAALTTAIANAIASLVNTAPTTLDTLKELADAIGDDANFSATMTAALGFRLRFDAAQTLTGPQKTQAIANLALATVAASGAYADLSGKPSLGTAAPLNVGTSASQVVQLDASAKLPAVDGSQLTNIGVKTVKVQKFTATGTYTPSAGMLYCIIECVGGGGGGAGADATSAGQLTFGGGGGSGGYSRKYATAALIGANKPVTIGGGGNGGAAGANNGGNGTATSVGALCSANGGGAGASTGTPSTGQGGAGATAGSGDVTIPGNAGTGGTVGGVVNCAGCQGAGAASVLGGAPGAAAINSFAQVGSGAPANTGAGGGGAGSGQGAGAAAGGNGGSGLVIITEYCSQ